MGPVFNSYRLRVRVRIQAPKDCVRKQLSMEPLNENTKLLTLETGIETHYMTRSKPETDVCRRIRRWWLAGPFPPTHTDVNDFRPRKLGFDLRPHKRRHGFWGRGMFGDSNRPLDVINDYRI